MLFSTSSKFLSSLLFYKHVTTNNLLSRLVVFAFTIFISIKRKIWILPNQYMGVFSQHYNCVLYRVAFD